jgi:hypothetical protein
MRMESMWTIPYGFHGLFNMDSMDYYIWIPFKIHGIHPFHELFHMDSMWNPWNPPIPYGIHMEYPGECKVLRTGLRRR